MHHSHPHATRRGWIIPCLLFLAAAAIRPLPAEDRAGAPKNAISGVTPAQTSKSAQRSNAFNGHVDDVSARVLTPDGRCAQRASIALAVGGSQVMINNGELEPLRDGPRSRETDDAGRFHVARQTADFWLVITHSSGFLRIRCSPKSTPETIRLKAWARVEGTLRVGRKLQPNAEVSLSLDGDDQHGPNDPLFFSIQTQTTDANGHFVFERVVPGRGEIARKFLARASDGPIISSSCRVPAQFVSGKTTHLDLGATGRPVIGQLQPSANSKVEISWNRSHVIVDPVDARDDVRQLVATLDGHGNFCVDDVPTGAYRLLILHFKSGAARLMAIRRFTVPPIDEKLSQRPIDLGVLKMRSDDP